MSSAKVDVTVRGAGEVVDGPLLRPVRVLPTRYAGVVYGGAVYPLHESNVIDLEDESYDKYDCGEFVELGEEIPYAPIARGSQSPLRRPTVALSAWYVEHNQYGNYLVFDADDETAQAAADLMVEVGLGVRRWDASWRPSSDGHQYDWFIRLEDDGPRDECARRIERALAAEASPSRSGVSTSVPPSEEGILPPQQALLEGQVRDLLRKVAALEGRCAVLQREREHLAEQSSRSLALAEHEHRRATEYGQQLANAECTERTLRRDLDITRRRRRQAEDDANALKNALQSAQREVGTDAQSSADERIAAKDQEIEELYAEWGRALQEKESLARDKASLDGAVKELQRQNDSMAANLTGAQQEVVELEAQNCESSNADQERRKVQSLTRGGASRSRVTVEQFIRTLLPRIDLDEEGLEALLRLKKPQRIFEVLRRLDDENPSPPSELIRGEAAKHARIQEVRRPGNTGDRDRANKGRIYWHRCGGRINVLVHVKDDPKEQDQTLLRFAKRCRQAEQRAHAS